MTTFGNQKKTEQLKMPIGTATAILRKDILFNLIQKCGLDICFQCGNKIEFVDDLSIEHKVPWLDSNDPVKNFFNLENIAFSHLKCNICSSRKIYRQRGAIKMSKNNIIHSPEGMHWCGHCKKNLPITDFHKKTDSVHGVDWECKNCKKRYLS
jgi:hypothetical protein